MPSSDPTQSSGFAGLRSTSWPVLGILSFGEELSGYDLKKWASYSVRFFYWSPSFSQVYSELKKLEDLGYVTSRTVVDDEARVKPKRLYKITDAGMAVMRSWAREAPIDPPVLKHGVMLRMWLGHLTEPEQLKDALKEHISYVEGMSRQAALDARDSDVEPTWAFAHMVNKWSERYYAAESELAKQMLADIDEAVERMHGEGTPEHPGVPKPTASHSIRRSREAQREYQAAMKAARDADDETERED